MATRFGEQPGRLILRRERWTIARAAREIDESYAHLLRSLRGVVRPSEQVRRRLPALVGRPVSDLFTPEALAEPPAPRRPRDPTSTYDERYPGTMPGPMTRRQRAAS